MSNPLSMFRKFGTGRIDESTMKANVNQDSDDISMYESDPQFMQESMAIALPIIIQGWLTEDSAEAMDENVKEAFITCQNYLAGQGLLSEAAVSISNPKINVVRLNKNAQISRLTSILTLKMGRKANHKAYKKYKLGQKIKKANMEELRKIYGAKAERLAKKLWAQTKKNNKVAAVVESKKGKK